MTTAALCIQTNPSVSADSTLSSDGIQATATQRRPKTSTEIRRLAQAPLVCGGTMECKQAIDKVFEEILFHEHYSEPELEPRLLLDVTDLWVNGKVFPATADIFVDCLRAIPLTDRAIIDLGSGWRDWLSSSVNFKQVLAELRKLHPEDKPSMLCVLLSAATMASDVRDAIRVVREAGKLDRNSFAVVMAHGIGVAKIWPDQWKYRMFKRMLRKFLTLFSDVKLERWGWDNYARYGLHQMQLIHGIGRLDGAFAGKLFGCWSRWQPEVDPETGPQWPERLVVLIAKAYPHAIPAFLESMNQDWKWWATHGLNEALQRYRSMNPQHESGC
jgi:hypothetical protein